MSNTVTLKKIAEEIDLLLSQNNKDKALEKIDYLTEKNLSAGLAYKGVFAYKNNDYDAAETYLLQSYAANPNQLIALTNLIPTYLKKKEYKKALSYAEKALGVLPDNRSVKINYAAACLHEQKFEEALNTLNPLLDEESPEASVLSGLISANRSLFNQREARRLLAIAKSHFPEMHEIMRLEADTLAESDPAEALVAFERALSNDNSNVATKWNMSLVQLRLGHFSDGWKNYDCGLLDEVGKIGRPLPKMFGHARRITDANELDSNLWTVAVSEQGIGDQVVFHGCMKEFLQDFPKTILIAESRMHSLLHRSFNIPIYTYGAAPLADLLGEKCNGYLPIGSIQKTYRGDRTSFMRNRSAYLIPDKEKVAFYRKKIEHHFRNLEDKKIIGISWKGGFWERAQATKTLPIQDWDPILSNEQYTFVSLQYGDVETEKQYTKGKYKNVFWIRGVDFKKQLDDWLALACACDSILSVSTALVHFAAAAGKKVDLLLSDKGNPFIWGLEDTEGLPYLDVKIHRKTREESMNEYFERVSNEIKTSR